MSEFINGKEVPHFVCHKVVQALEIGRVELDAPTLGHTVHFKDQQFGSLYCEPGMTARYIPVPGDFLVFYEDQYKSFSPRAAFIGGYTEKK